MRAKGREMTRGTRESSTNVSSTWWCTVYRSTVWMVKRMTEYWLKIWQWRMNVYSKLTGPTSVKRVQTRRKKSIRILTNHKRNFLAPWQQFFLEEASLLGTSWVPAINHVDRALLLTSRFFDPISHDVVHTGETSATERVTAVSFR